MFRRCCITIYGAVLYASRQTRPEPREEPLLDGPAGAALCVRAIRSTRVVARRRRAGRTSDPSPVAGVETVRQVTLRNGSDEVTETLGGGGAGSRRPTPPRPAPPRALACSVPYREGEGGGEGGGSDETCACWAGLRVATVTSCSNLMAPDAARLGSAAGRGRPPWRDEHP